MKHQKSNILLIIPCYNEQANIAKLLQENLALPKPYDTIVIDDGSSDDSIAIAKEYSSVVVLPYNLGIGGAVQTGIKYAYQNNYDFCVQIDGDGQHIPAEVAKLFAHYQQTQDNLIIGSRYIDNASFRSTPLRRLGNMMIARLINLLFKAPHLTDTTSGMRLMDRKAIALYQQHYPLDFPEPISLTWGLQKNLRVAEISVNMRARESGESSISAKKSIIYMIRVIGYIVLCKISF